jgi:hypothetical protein
MKTIIRIADKSSSFLTNVGDFDNSGRKGSKAFCASLRYLVQDSGTKSAK